MYVLVLSIVDRFVPFILEMLNQPLSHCQGGPYHSKHTTDTDVTCNQLKTPIICFNFSFSKLHDLDFWIIQKVGEK